MKNRKRCSYSRSDGTRREEGAAKMRERGVMREEEERHRHVFRLDLKSVIYKMDNL